ncbi:MAG: 4Fe-4S dicluster domain-containing protein [Planctomycetes bacterium]|jgi:NADH-quinone oxidoreductase subunit I|nr:4Fe-4S dicluster domain-containing protein [Planctomycetota bacterium]
MPIRDADTVTVDLPPLNAAESFYLPEVFKGLGTTFRHITRSIGGSKRKANKALEYPEQRREHYDVEDGGLHVGNFRGVHRLNRDEAGRVRCVACFMCSTACPADCIHIEGAASPWDDREKYPVKFDLDELRCIFCGMCEEACPVDAIELTQAYDVIGLSRQEMIFDKQKLLAVYDATIEGKPM